MLCSSKSMLVSNRILIHESHCMFILISDATFIHAIDFICSLVLCMSHIRFDILMSTLKVMFIPCYCHTNMRYHIHAYIAACVNPCVGLYINSCLRPHISACLHVCVKCHFKVYIGCCSHAHITCYIHAYVMCYMHRCIRCHIHAYAICNANAQI